MIENSKHQDQPGSVDYYEAHAQRFFDETVGVDMQPIYRRFLPSIPTQGHILDAGCGSGRDLRAFRDLGYQVTGIDASPSLVELAREFAQVPVHDMTFHEIPWLARFDAIWACASLLHVPRHELPGSLRRLAKALVTRGTLYLSFKHGTTDREKDGRFFTDMNEPRLEALLRETRVFEPIDIWITVDRRPDRADERWLNAVLRRVEETGGDEESP